jgi:peptide/nickel transport system substrate-binding protein
MVPNPHYSGPVKATISKFVELPFTSEAAIYNQMRSGGPSALTISTLPSQYKPQVPQLENAGFTYNTASSYSVNYFPLNWNNPTIGPVFRQLYFRQALQHLVDQPGWIHAFLNNTANETSSPIPPAPPSPLVSASAVASNPYPFDVAAAKKLLADNGWKVNAGGTSTCEKPGTAAGDCGAGVKKGLPLTFNIDYQSGVVSVQDEMNDLQAQAKKVGINLQLTSHPFDEVISNVAACTPTQAVCKWTAQNWGAGWIYGPDYLPTGESLYAPGAVANYGSYDNPQSTKLIQDTITGPAGSETQALSNYAKQMEQDAPVVWGPTSIGTYGGGAGTMIASNLGGYAANALGLMNPENWYFVKK